MKRMFTIYLPLTLCLAATVFFACQKKEQQAVPLEPAANTSVFNKSVGAPLDSATAKRWKRRLAEQRAQSRMASATATVYYISAAALKSLISLENTVGICFYFGQDSLGRVSLVPVGIDNRGYVMRAETVQTSTGQISWSTARSWRIRFKEQQPNGIWGYFWGSNAVQRLLAQGVETVRIELGINDEGKQQIMFSDATITDPAGYEDMTSTCPPYCPIDTEIGY